MGGFEEKAAKLDVKGVIVTMILSALGFLTAFQWRDAIKEAIDTFIPTGEGLFYTFLAAIVVTIIAIIVTFVLIKLEQIDIIPEKYEEKIKNKVRRKKKQETNG